MGLPISLGFENSAPDRSLRISESAAPAYSACTGLFTPMANPTDVMALIPAGYMGGIIQVKKIIVSGISSSAGGTVPVRIVSSNNSGLNGYASVPALRRDKYDVNSTCVAWRFTGNRTNVNPAATDTRSFFEEADLTFGVQGVSAGVPAVFDFTGSLKPPTIKQAYEWITVNLLGNAMPAGAQLRVTIHWVEQTSVRIAFCGDSTTANATPALLNNGQNSGGMGNTGVLNAAAIIDNLGSNGHTLRDFVNNANGCTYPMQQMLTWGYDVIPVCYGINDARTGRMGATSASCINRLSSMLDTVFHATLNGMVSGVTYVSPLATRYMAASATWSGGLVNVVTTGAHGYQVGESVTLQLSGFTPSAYNGVYTCTFPNASTVRYALASNPGAVTGLGQCVYATTFAANTPAIPDAKLIAWGPNSITTDDVGGGPWYWLSASGNATLSGLWTGMTLAQAAQALSDILYQAYEPFRNDPRLFGFLQKQDIFGRTAQTTAASKLMTDQLHPNGRGQTLSRRQILPVLKAAINAVIAERC